MILMDQYTQKTKILSQNVSLWLSSVWIKNYVQTEYEFWAQIKALDWVLWISQASQKCPLS